MSLVGTGLPARIRSTVAAMLGMTTAAGLALILFFVQTSWPIPSLGPLALPRGGQAGLQGGISLGGAESTGPAASGPGAGRGAGGPALAVTVPFAAVETGATTTEITVVAGNPGGGDQTSGSAPGATPGQNATGGGSQQATPSPATPVRGSDDNAEAGEEAPAPESAPVSTPVSTPTTPASEPPAFPTGEEPPFDGEEPIVEEPPAEAEPPVEEEPPAEEPPLEEGETGGEGEEAEADEQLHPGSGI